MPTAASRSVSAKARLAGVDLLWSRLCMTGSSARRPPVGSSAAAAGRADGSGCAGLQVGGHLGVSIAVTEVLDIVEHNGDLGRQTTVTDLGRTLGIDQPR